MKGACIQCKDRPDIDPFTFNEAETPIRTPRRDWGGAQANYNEFRFFTRLRPSEQIALLVSDCDVARGALIVTKAAANLLATLSYSLSSTVGRRPLHRPVTPDAAQIIGHSPPTKAGA
jgi:hypothetical protein